MDYKLFSDFGDTPVFKEGGIGTKRLLDAKMMRPVCKALYSYVTPNPLYRDTLGNLPSFFEDYDKRYYIDYAQSVKRLSLFLWNLGGGSHYKNEWELISFANNATICTLVAMRRCLAHTFPNYFDGDESLKPYFYAIKISSKKKFTFGFGFDYEPMLYPTGNKGDTEVIAYVREGYFSAKRELKRYGIVLETPNTLYNSYNGHVFEIPLYQNFYKLKDRAEYAAGTRLHPVPEGATFNFDDPLAGLPFED